MEPNRALANQVIESCESTNDLARTLGEAGNPHGTWISAREQTRGRGRLGRSWLSMPGNLFLSVIVRNVPQKLWTWVPLAAAVGTAEALLAHEPSLDLRIKWPNDLWIGVGEQGAKTGGILCEGIGSASGDPFLIVGIGVNCATPPDADAVEKSGGQRATSLSHAAGRTIVADDVRTEVIDGILSAVEAISARGPAVIASRYTELAALPPMSWIEWSAQGRGESAQIIGLGVHGELRVRTASGVEQALYAEDVKVRALKAR